MSHGEGLDATVRLAQANRVATAHEHVDTNRLVRQCPAHAPHIFVVPVRYALSEEPAAHPACQPGVAPKSHPLAARPLRSGFVYVWHHQGARLSVTPLARTPCLKSNRWTPNMCA